MFNFDLLNEAVFDVELTDKEFRLLYVIANNAAKNNTNTVQLHNGWLMDKLNCCERQIRRLTNGLNEKGYLIKSVSGTSKNKNANNYTLERTLQADKNVPLKTINNAINCAVSNENIINYNLERTLQADKNVPLKTNLLKNEDKLQYDDKIVDKNVDKNVPLKNNKKIKENINNLSTIDMKDLGPEVYEIKKENKKEKVNEMKNAVLNEMERKDNEMITSTSGEKNTNFNLKEPVYGNLTDELFDEIFGISSTEVDDDTTGDKVSETENEMSDNGTSVMNAKSEMTTSTQGNIITSNSGNDEHKVQSDKVNCSKPYLTPQIPLAPLSSPNKAAGDVETPKMEQLPTSKDKNAPGGKKTPNNAYNLQQWMTKYNKIISDIENTDVEDCHFDTLLDEGCKLIENFPTNEGNYKRQMQDLRYWVARKVDFQKSFKISEKWNKYYRAA